MTNCRFDSRFDVSNMAFFAVAIIFCLPVDNPRCVANTVVIDASDRGWYRDEGFHSPDLPGTIHNYLAGNFFSTIGLPEPRGAEFRNWFVFDTSTVALPVIGAELRLLNPASSSADGAETFTIFEVGTPVAELTAGGTDRTDIFQDLADGTIYGSQSITTGGLEVTDTIPLNGDFLTALLSSPDRRIALGGTVTTLDSDGLTQESLFAFSQGRPLDVTQLILSVAPLFSADFDLDNDVDGHDFLKWQRGETHTPLSQTELADWQSSYGMVAPIANISLSVPEPNTLLFCWIALLLVPQLKDWGQRELSAYSNRQSRTCEGETCRR